MRKIHYISGLPQSGGSILGKLLDQDPDVTVAPDNTACHDILALIRDNWADFDQHIKNPDTIGSKESLRKTLHGLLGAYCDVTKPIHFDKGASWLSHIEMMEYIMNREIKIIVPVRSIPNIAASLEAAYRDNSHVGSPFPDSETAQTVENRIEYWISDKGCLGKAYKSLKDAIQRGLGSRLFLFEYDDLVSQPEKAMAQLWEWLDMDAPEADYSIIEAPKDNGFATRIIGEDLYDQLSETEFWRADPSQRQTN